MMRGSVRAVLVIGASGGAERPLDERRGSPLRIQHVHQYVIVQNVERVRRDLGRHVAIADVPGEREQIEVCRRADFHEALDSRAHLHEPSGLKLNRVSIIEDIRPLEIEQKIGAPIRPQGDAPPMPIAVVERNHVDDTIRRDMLAADDF